MTKYAFRCNNCGALEPAGAAGERELPGACHMCGRGVAFDPTTGIKSYDDANWAVLADASEAELKKSGLEASDVARHKPFKATATREPQNIDRSVTETVGAEDRP